MKGNLLILWCSVLNTNAPICRNSICFEATLKFNSIHRNRNELIFPNAFSRIRDLHRYCILIFFFVDIIQETLYIRIFLNIKNTTCIVTPSSTNIKHSPLYSVHSKIFHECLHHGFDTISVNEFLINVMKKFCNYFSWVRHKYFLCLFTQFINASKIFLRCQIFMCYTNSLIQPDTGKI